MEVWGSFSSFFALLSFSFPMVKDAKHRLVFCAMLMHQGGCGFLMDVKLQREKWRGIFQNEFVVNESHYWTAPSPSFRENPISGQHSFTDWSFTVSHLLIRNQLCNGELKRVFLGVSGHLVPHYGKLWKLSRDHIQVTSKKIKIQKL